MAVDPSNFHLWNAVDTCAVWNILSSTTMYQAARGASVGFCCTTFVQYECLHKPRRKEADAQLELQRRLQLAQASNDFAVYELDLDDLQQVALLELRRRLGKGELSSIAFAIKTRQAFLTDDQMARKLAHEVMGHQHVQTTPHLFGWLFYCNLLMDSDKDTIINQHEGVGGQLKRYLEDMYVEALRCRLMAHPSGDVHS